MTHTPGPWVLQANGAALNVRRLDDVHHMILLNMKHITQDAFEANARLIAAAPQLLEACKALIIPPKMPIADCPADAGTFFPCECGFHDAIEQARAAIAAAEGDTP